MKPWNVLRMVVAWGLACGIWPATLHAQAPANTPQEYIAQWSDVAIRQMIDHRIPASITLAQGILESGNGNSELARVSNNHFGIKCHSDWTGSRAYHDDDEQGECFRVYDDASASFHDHSEFLKRTRYAELFELEVTDYRGWAKGLKRCGYATNPQYADKLIDLVERYELYVYDDQALKLMEQDAAFDVARTDLAKTRLVGGREILLSDNAIQYVVALPGDTYEALAHSLDLMRWQFYRYNEVERKSGDHELEAGEIVYLQPKRSHGMETWTTVQEGETLWAVSQRTGVSMKAIVRKNRLTVGEPLQAGTRLALKWRLTKEGTAPWYAREEE